MFIARTVCGQWAAGGEESVLSLLLSSADHCLVIGHTHATHCRAGLAFLAFVIRFLFRKTAVLSFFIKLYETVGKEKWIWLIVLSYWRS